MRVQSSSDGVLYREAVSSAHRIYFDMVRPSSQLHLPISGAQELAHSIEEMAQRQTDSENHVQKHPRAI